MDSTIMLIWHCLVCHRNTQRRIDPMAFHLDRIATLHCRCQECNRQMFHTVQPQHLIDALDEGFLTITGLEEPHATHRN